MEQDEEINRYKESCKEHFEGQGLEVHLDIALSPEVRWRPHLFVKNETKMILDIVETEDISSFQLSKFVDVMNAFPLLGVAVVLIGGIDYLPDLISNCAKYGLGIFIVRDGLLKQILPCKPRDVEALSSSDPITILPGSPFGNILGLRKCFRKFRDYLYWFELNLPKSSLEILYENIKHGDLAKVKEIKLLRGIDDKITKSYRDEFESFRDEVVSFDVGVEMRVIMDRKVTREVHGRYMYSSDEQGSGIKVQVPPLNSLRGDQWDSIFTDVKIIPPFDGYWSKGKDVLDEWSVIEKAVKEYAKRKEEEAAKLLEASASL